MISEDLKSLSKTFKWFSSTLATQIQTSPFYASLSFKISQDKELMTLSGHAQPGQPIPNMLFGAVHFLLLHGIEHKLARFYPTITNDYLDASGVFPYFKSFCLEYYEELKIIIEKRRVQTNEIQRCALFLPGLEFFTRKNKSRPFNLIEIGSSAGLNLNYNLYQYQYNTTTLIGSKNSGLKLNCELQGSNVLPLPTEGKIPMPMHKIGVDIYPLNIANAEDRLWLKALIWPYHLERFNRLDTAIHIAKKHPPNVVQGDGLELLPELVMKAKNDFDICIFHSFTLNQFSEQKRAAFYAKLRDLSFEKTMYVLSIEWLSSEGAMMMLDIYKSGDKREYTLARCQAHGKWINWLSKTNS